ncbi:hypothetical protein EDB84DRAFT_1580002 [Lactarius hengduanensis]|nr:hypothetical protein EDB84DRAFT_1580002 [Lactarius hengduanensis]
MPATYAEALTWQARVASANGRTTFPPFPPLHSRSGRPGNAGGQADAPSPCIARREGRMTIRGSQCPPPLGLPGPPFSPIRAATFTRKGGARALFPTTPRRPRPFPLVRAAPFARTEGVRRQAAPPLHVGSGPAPSLLSKGARGHADPGTLSPLAAPPRRGVRESMPPPFPVAPDTSPSRPGAPPSAPHPSPFARTGGVHEGTPPPALPFTLGPRHPVQRGMEAREGTPPVPTLPHSRGRGCTRRGPLSPSLPAPPPLATTSPAAPYAGTLHPGPPFPIRAEGGAPSACHPVRAEQGHAAPAPRFLLSALPRSHGKGACEGKPPHPVAPRSRGNGRMRPRRVEQLDRRSLLGRGFTASVAVKFRHLLFVSGAGIAGGVSKLYRTMASQVSRKFAFAKQALLGLLPQLEEDLGDAAVADELAQTFSVALEMVHSSAAEATLDVAADSEVAALVAVARDRLLPYATASWRKHSPHLVAEEEEPRSSSVAAAPPAPLDVPGGYTRLAEYRLQVEAGTMSRADFEAHRSAILLSDPGLGLPSSLAVSSPLLRLSMEPAPAGGSGSPAADLTELFSNQSLQSPALRAVTAAPSPSEGAAAPSEAAAASRASGSRSRSRRLTAEPVPDADSAPRRGVKRGRNPPLMNVSQIPGYVRVRRVSRDVCFAFSAKSSARLFSVLGRRIRVRTALAQGRECIRPAGGRARGRPAVGPSGDPATEGLRLPASAFFGPEVASSGVALAATIMFWRAEVARVLAARRALDVQLSFAEWQYSHFLGGLIEPGPSSTLPPRKRARTGASGKGKEKAADAGALSDEVEIVEPMDEAQDGADEAVWAGFPANFGLE